MGFEMRNRSVDISAGSWQFPPHRSHMRLFVSGATATLRRHLDVNRLGVLLVPGAGNGPKLALSLGLPWAADNAAFCALLARISGHPGCRFVACPDVVGD